MTTVKRAAGTFRECLRRARPTKEASLESLPENRESVAMVFQQYLDAMGYVIETVNGFLDIVEQDMGNETANSTTGRTV